MRILLQHRKTGLYYRAPGLWTKTPEEAYEFPSSGHLIHFQQSHNLEDVRMIFRFPSEGYSIQIPLEDAPRQFAQAAS